jgi:RNA polymerase sigma-70 factor (ECF subfamily)
MKCDELLALLSDYVDGDIPPGACADLEKHLAGCDPCQVVVDNIRKTITLYKAGEPYELPPEFQQRLHKLLEQQWDRKRSC